MYTPCFHCGKSANKMRRRGLCSVCYNDNDIRSFYREMNCNTGAEDFCGQASEPSPTNALPRSDAKIRVMRSRVSRREELFSDRDNTFDLR